MIRVNPATLWHRALQRLELLPVDVVARVWLRTARLMPVAPTRESPATAGERETLSFWLLVPDALASALIQQQCQPAIEQALAELVQQPVTLRVVTASGAASDAPREAHADEEMEMAAMEDRQRSTETFVARPSRNDSPPPSPYYDYDLPSKPPGQALRDSALAEPLAGGAPAWEQESAGAMPNRLNPRYTFDAFIVGNSNRLAHAASYAVAEAPGEAYNPLFLYGGVGLGKTHLLHAIGHKGAQAGLTVLYVSSEQFTNEIINAIRYRTTEEFRAKYRSVDILLVDDIQFIAGKESTEEEFFHTFNSLYEMSKQIVICSDRPPKAIVSLEERLRSRFEWGLIADIQPPDLETRMAILRVKADMLHYPVPDEVIAYIASRVQTNIRELEGCLNRLMAYQQLHRTELTLDVARAAMSSLGNGPREVQLSGRQIAQAVADYFRIPLEAMCGKQRDKQIVIPRQIAMYLIRQETQLSLLEIGQLFGGRDHSTVLHACEKIERAMQLDPGLRRDVVAIRELLLPR
ncbi:chromosomal replication initiator protein DnaA [Thermogemmatispora onikobensis]|uniref:chromosomal replication initiator protein DnaA n=1 Tax=Thermogemmatispora onikobensis TaxID=732234 RepID=UPI000852E1FA|nr:chromosomal replication initiator protein DnaA [Thermogemmatispora onikobensis]